MEAKFVLHAVGPRYHEYEPAVSELLLAACVINTLERAKELKA
jgi:O-acetyl-ADP-ribose deacetylase (regulator of RNase III)